MDKTLQFVKEHKLILIAVVSVAAICWWWWCVANDWGTRVVPKEGAWTPNLLGDSFGFINAILTAAAFVAVVATYRKEQEQLKTVKEQLADGQKVLANSIKQLEDSRAQYAELKERAEEERHEAIIIDVVRNGIRLLEEKRDTFYERNKQSSPQELAPYWQKEIMKYGYYAPLNTACQLMVDEKTRIGDFTFLALCTRIRSLLTLEEKEAINNSFKYPSSNNRVQPITCNYLWAIVFAPDTGRMETRRTAESILRHPPPNS